MGTASFLGLYSKLQRQRLIGPDTVLLMDRSAPAVIAPNAGLAGHDPDPCVVDTGQLINMHGIFQLISAVRKNAGGKWLLGHGKAKAMAFLIICGKIAHAFTVAALLGDQVAG